MIPICTTVRENILKLAHMNGAANLPVCFAVVETLYAAYCHMQHRADLPDWPDRDIFIMSSGDAHLAHYCMLAAFGYFDITEACTPESGRLRFSGSGDRKTIPGVDLSTGSPGQGIGMAAGSALAQRMRAGGRRTFVLTDARDAVEGCFWDAVSAAAHYKLANLTILYTEHDTICRHTVSAAQRLQSFGCDVFKADGHDVSGLQQALKKPSETVKAVVCKTVPGYGCTTLSKEYHNWLSRIPGADDLKFLTEELHAQAL